ncbi:Ras family protein [Histomonas meleagridis]|uniref:Ras family protein n=1 Tax=Histomonas meleagridis TaxID=135588 RepID=UPI00355A2083|nr:Ras family protein [Histomonas meleagridis]KAH0800635.1 Ras family protein [Histomonas meleagridis]
MKEALQFKFIVIGASGGGKTSILKVLTEGKFAPGTQSTIGIDYYTYNTTIENQPIKMMLWDTAGQERFYTIVKSYYRAAVGCVLVYDITNRSSFEQLPKWLKDATVEADPHCSFILVGNKVDLSSKRTVSSQEAEEFARTHNLMYMETSALENTQISELFLKLGTDTLHKYIQGEITAMSMPKETVKENQEEDSGKCC